MKFHNQSKFKGHTITNVLDKPIMHKKGKQWVVISLSALMLLGLGGVASATSTHASVVPNGNNQATAVKNNINAQFKQSAQLSAKPVTSVSANGRVAIATNDDSSNNVEAQAKTMVHGLMKTAMTKPNVNTNRQGSNEKAVGLQKTGSQPKQASPKVVYSDNSYSVNDLFNNKGYSDENDNSTVTSDHLALSNPKVSDAQRHVVAQNGSWYGKFSDDYGERYGQLKGNNNSTASQVPTVDNKIDVNANKQAQAKAWNFVQYGINGNDFDPNGADNHKNAKADANKHNAIGQPNVGLVSSQKKSSLGVSDSQSNFFSGTKISDQTYDGLTYNLYSNGGVEFIKGMMPSDMTNGFTDNSPIYGAKAIKFDADVDTSKVTDMRGMFGGQSSLKSLDLSHFNTSKVTDMSDMFMGDSNLQNLDLSHFDTSNVTDMSHMFMGDTALQSLDLSHFDTSKVTNMNDMFQSDRSLQNLDLSHFDTSNVTDMNNMFLRDSSLQSLDLSHFDTSKVTNMSYMFYSDSALQSLDLSNLDTSKVTDMSDMLQSDNNLVYLNLGGKFSTKSVKHDDWMFASSTQPNDLANKNTYSTLAKRGLFLFGPSAPMAPTAPSAPSGVSYPIDPQELVLSSNDKFDDKSLFNKMNSNWYQALPKKDMHDKSYTTNDKVNLGQGLAGVWLKEANPEPAQSKTVHDKINYIDDQGTQVASDDVDGNAGSVFKPSDVDNIDTVPSGYQLVKNDDKYPVPAKFGNSDAIITLHVTPQDNASANIDVNPNEVNVFGTVNLHFINKDGTTMTTIPLDYSLQTNADNKSDIPSNNALENLNDSDERVANPSDYTLTGQNKNIFQLDNGQLLDASNYSYNPNDTRTTKTGSFITVQPNDTTYVNGSQRMMHKDVDLYFDAKNATENVQFFDNTNKRIGSDRKFSDFQGAQVPVNSSDIAKLVPHDYQLATNGVNPADITVNNGATATLHVTKKQATAELQPSSGSKAPVTVTGVIDNKVTPSDLEKAVPQGYHLNPSATAIYNNDATPQTVSVDPNTESQEVIYYYNNGNQKVLVGNDYFTGANNTQFDVTSSNASGLNNTGYQLANADSTNLNKFTFKSDAPAFDVPVSLKSNNNSDTLNYVDLSGKSIKSDVNAGKGTPSDTTILSSFVLTNKPTNYDLVEPNQSFKYDGGVHDVLVTPSTGAKAIIQLVDASGREIGQSDATITGKYNQNAKPYVLNALAPKGYHVVNPNQTITYNNNKKTDPQNLTVAPNIEHEIVRYYYNQNGKNVFAGDDYFTGNYGTKLDVTSANDHGLNSGYQLVHATNNGFTFSEDADNSENGNIDNVAVQPTQTSSSDSIQYVALDGTKLNDRAGKPTLDLGAGTPSDALPDATINSDAPANYHVIAKDEVVYHDGATHDVFVAPNSVHNTLKYMDGSKKVSSDTPQGYYKQTGDAEDYLPSGYSLAQGQAPDFTFGPDDTTQNIKVQQNKNVDTIIYVDDDNNSNKGNVVGSYKTNSDIPTKALALSNVPTGYQVEGTPNLKYDGLTHVVKVNGAQNSGKVEITVISKDSNGQTTSKQISDIESGYVGDIYTINSTDANVVQAAKDGYEPEAKSLTGQITPGQPGVSQGNVTFVFDEPQADSHAITVYYRTSGNQTVNTGTITGNINSTGTIASAVPVPKGYQVAVTQPAQPSTFKIQKNPQYINIQVVPDSARDVLTDPNKQGLSPSDKQKATDALRIQVIAIYKNGQNQSEKTFSDSFDYDTSNIGDTKVINPDNQAYQKQGYTADKNDKITPVTLTTDGATPTQITFVYDANSHSGMNVSYKDGKGKPVVPSDGSTKKVTGNTNSDISGKITPPKGYHVVSPVTIPSDEPSSDGNITVKLAGDHVVGRAKLYLEYKRGNHTSAIIKYLPISGTIGDSDMVISPYTYSKRGYKTDSTQAWHIPFDANNVVAGENDNDMFRYEPENTFVYEAQSVPKIEVTYVDKVTGQSLPETSSDTITGPFYDGDVVDLQSSNDSNSYISVDNHDYQLNVPTGYHLSHTNNYVTIVDNSTHQDDGKPVFHLRLMLFAMPDFNKKGSHKTIVQPTDNTAKHEHATEPKSDSSATGYINNTPVNPNLQPSSLFPTDTGATYDNDTFNTGSSYITNNYDYATSNTDSLTHGNTTSAQPMTATSQPIEGIKYASQLQQAPYGVTIIFHRMHIQRLNPKDQNLYYFYAIKDCFLHSDLKFTKRNRMHKLTAKQAPVMRIERIFKVNGAVRFEVRLGHGKHSKLAFVTGDSRYTKNAYVQYRDMRRNKHSYRYIRLLKPACEYRFRRFGRWDRVRTLKKGKVLKVRRLVTIAKYHMTRFQLTNGKWVTANKTYIKLFK